MQRWIAKFANAFRGLASGSKGQSSFAVHIPTAVAVLILAAVLRCELWQWCTLLICIGWVLSMEFFNSAIEQLAKGLCDEHNPRVGAALDIASTAVLFSSLFSALVGLLIFASRILLLVN